VAMLLVRLPALGVRPLAAAPLPSVAVALLHLDRQEGLGVPQHLARVDPTRLGVVLQEGRLEDQHLVLLRSLSSSPFFPSSLTFRVSFSLFHLFFPICSS